MRSLTAETAAKHRPAGAVRGEGHAIPAGRYAGAPSSAPCGSTAQDARDLLAVERLALEQRPGQAVELLEVRLEDVARPGRAVESRSA